MQSIYKKSKKKKARSSDVSTDKCWRMYIDQQNKSDPTDEIKTKTLE